MGESGGGSLKDTRMTDRPWFECLFDHSSSRCELVRDPRRSDTRSSPPTLRGPYSSEIVS
jgi:hypothetical protein